VIIRGSGTAIVRMRRKLDERTVGDLIRPPTYEVTDVWVRREGCWQVVRRVREPVLDRR
jgi:hypothetical protein